MKRKSLQNSTQKISLQLASRSTDIAKASKQGDVLVVIDALRCCSTIIAALAYGANTVIPEITVSEARISHQRNPESLLAGERSGVKPRGFDMGNSPLEFTQGSAEGKCVILTTTNGTKAICLSGTSGWTLIGAFLNAAAVAKRALGIAKREATGISFVLSGTHGRFSLEDFICAGAIVEYLPASHVDYSDRVTTALLAFQQAHQRLAKTIHRGRHAQFLEEIGHGEDVDFCCQLNQYPIVPRYTSDGIGGANR